jgi:hypothetical protein
LIKSAQSTFDKVKTQYAESDVKKTLEKMSKFDSYYYTNYNDTTPKDDEFAYLFNGEKAEMVDAVKAPNSILKVMVATQQYQAKPDSLSSHAINLINCLVEAPEINMKKLKYLVFNGGIPDDVNGLRPIIWRIMLGMWPADTSQWVDILR